MKEMTRYKYEKKIKDLEARVAILINYETFSKDIIDVLHTAVRDNKVLSNSWIIQKIRYLLLK